MEDQQLQEETFRKIKWALALIVVAVLLWFLGGEAGKVAAFLNMAIVTCMALAFTRKHKA